jgi:hypothetical protein
MVMSTARSEVRGTQGPERPATVWLGWAYLTKTMRKPQRGGVNFDPPIVCCACSMQNVPTADKMLQMSSYLV